MISIRSLAIHLGLFMVAGVFALFALLRKEEDALQHHEVQLWASSPDSLARVEFKSAKRTVVLERQTDDQGAYFVATVDREKPSKERPPVKPVGDAGAPEPTPPPAERETVRFVAVKEAKELVDSLSTLKAKRRIGKLDASRLEEFGFTAEEEKKLSLQLGNRSRELIIGGSAPGGSDTYVREPESGETFVIAASIARGLESAESRLMERNLHAWEQTTVSKAVLKAGDVSRELRRIKDQGTFWANPEQPETKDESASNWMTKLERLRVTEFEEKPDPEPVTLVSVEYFSEAGKKLGFVELLSQPLPGEEKPRYLVKTETTRWHGVVMASTAEQLAQDLASILNP